MSLERWWLSLIGSDAFRRLSKHGVAAPLFRSAAYQRLYLTYQWWLTQYQCLRAPTLFQDVETYCLFIGHTKSGNSMIGSLLDAHPQIILADEVHALQFVEAGFSREQIFHILLRASRREAIKGRVTARRLQAYSWQVPGQWQGRYRDLRVLGDSTSGSVTRTLAAQPALLEKLAGTMGNVKLRFLHLIRNPYDPLSVMMVRGKRTFENALEHYTASCEMLVTLYQKIGAENIFPIRYEDFLQNPQTRLQEICQFLGLQAPPDYLQACAAILHPPERTRQLIAWDAAQIAAVAGIIARFDFLQGYSFDP